jgi:hypothetical protein
MRAISARKEFETPGFKSLQSGIGHSFDRLVHAIKIDLDPARKRSLGQLHTVCKTGLIGAG